MVARPSANGFTSNPVRVGNVSGVGVIAELGVGLLGGVVATYVTLSQNYQMEYPGGYPIRPPAGAPPKFSGNLVPSGTRLQFLKPEADALVAAGFAAYS